MCSEESSGKVRRGGGRIPAVTALPSALALRPPRASREGRQPVRLRPPTTDHRAWRNAAGLRRGRRGPLPASREPGVRQLRVGGHSRILLHWAGSTAAEAFPADICPIYFQNPPTATLGNLFLCFPTES